MRHARGWPRFTGAVQSPKYGVALLFFLVLGVVLLAPSARAGDPARGRALYSTHCASCHGPRGVPTMPGAPDFTRADALLKPDSVLMLGIKVGRNAMPAYNAVLKDRDILDVIAFMRTLK